MSAHPWVCAHLGSITRILLLAASLMAACPACATPPHCLALGFPDAGWSTHADAPWWAVVDARGMLNLFHPFVVSETGAAAGATCTVTIPPAWKPPFLLRFYCADDYFADAARHRPGQPGTESFFGHRFKQVLLNDTVVWEREVTDENLVGSPVTFEVDVTRLVRPGRPFTLTCRVLDRVSTRERNPQDVWFITGTWYAPGEGGQEQEPRFHTSVWFADVVIGEAAAVRSHPPGTRPHEVAAAVRHRTRWPLPYPCELKPGPVGLELVSPQAIPAPGYPLRCGVPLPPGMVREGARLRLCDATGSPLPMQARITGWWPDRSARWTLLQAVVPAGAPPGSRFRLEPLGAAARGSPQVRVERAGGRVTIDTRAVRVHLGDDPGALVDSLSLAGQAPVLTALRPEVRAVIGGRAQALQAVVERMTLPERGPVTTCVEGAGRLTAGRRRLAGFVFRLQAWAGLPHIQVSFRVVNETKPEPWRGTAADPPLAITRLELVGRVPGIAGCALGLGENQALIAHTRVRLCQDQAAQGRAAGDVGPPAPAGRAPGWIMVHGAQGSLLAAVAHFWQQYPKSLQVEAGRLRVGLFAATPEHPHLGLRFGEAKRHDLVLSLLPAPPAPSEAAALAELASRPPRLFDQKWFCQSGGLAVLDPAWFEHHPELQAYVAQHYGEVSSERVTGQFGVRNFGDMPYGSSGQWCNGYWSMVQGALYWGVASGDQRWIERSFEMARHLADTDTVHLPRTHPDWKQWDGITCALGTDHSVHNDLARWPAFQLGDQLVLHYWMTGDPDSLAAAVANAEAIIRHRSGLYAVEARSQARPLLTLLRVWQATGRDRYRRAAARYLDRKQQAARVVEWRRGAYLQPTYQNYRCISAGLDAMYAHNAYEYYRLTGDLEAAQMVVAIADSVLAESMLPQEEGLGSFLFYVRYSRGSWYYTQMAMLFHMAYDLTGDDRFLRAGRAAFARYLLCRDGTGAPMYQPFNNFGWLDPEFGGWEQRLASVPTRPFRVTSQTPDPDPARYEK